MFLYFPTIKTIDALLKELQVFYLCIPNEVLKHLLQSYFLNYHLELKNKNNHTILQIFINNCEVFFHLPTWKFSQYDALKLSKLLFDPQTLCHIFPSE